MAGATGFIAPALELGLYQKKKERPSNQNDDNRKELQGNRQDKSLQ